MSFQKVIQWLLLNNRLDYLIFLTQSNSETELEYLDHHITTRDSRVPLPIWKKTYLERKDLAKEVYSKTFTA